MCFTFTQISVVTIAPESGYATAAASTAGASAIWETKEVRAGGAMTVRKLKQGECLEAMESDPGMSLVFEMGERGTLLNELK